MTRYRPLGGPAKVIHDVWSMPGSKYSHQQASVKCGFCDAIEEVKEIATGVVGAVKEVQFTTLLPPCAHWEIIRPDTITWTF